MSSYLKKQSYIKGKADKDVVETLDNIKDKLKKRQKFLIISLLIFVGAVILILGFIAFDKSSLSKATLLEYEGYKFYYSTSTNVDKDQDKYQKALEKFKESFTVKKNPRVLYYIANCYYELGNYDETINTLQKLLKEYSEPQIASYAYLKMSSAYLKKNDKEKALNSLQNLFNLKEGVLQDLALIESAKILESMGKTEEAKDRYKKVVESYPKSIFVNEAKAKVGEKKDSN
ncbi:MAG: tetratricopeptide repeat protein [Thermodesulfovibrionales bacterium]|nr:tetratricopeptide repeat protein [Thermodesulfovibrionales bacterium]